MNTLLHHGPIMFSDRRVDHALVIELPSSEELKRAVNEGGVEFVLQDGVVAINWRPPKSPKNEES